MDKLFRYQFKDRDDSTGQWYYVDGSGNVSLSPTVKYLTEDPAGWEDMQVAMDRDMERGGVFRKSGVALKFHGDAGKIARHILYSTFGTGKCIFIAEQQNRDFTTNNWDYVLWYSCQLAFTTFGDGDTELPPGPVFFTARFIELGLPALLEANSNTPYEIPLFTMQPFLGGQALLPDPDAKLVRLGGDRMDGSYEWIVPETKDPTTGTPINITSGGSVLDAFPLKENVIVDLGAPTIADHDGIINPIGHFFDNDSVFDYSGIVKLKTRLSFVNTHATKTLQVKLRLRQFTLAGVQIGTDNLFYTTSNIAPGGGTFDSGDISFDIPLTISKDTRILIDLRFLDASTGTQITGSIPEWRVVTDGQLKLDVSFVLPKSFAWGYRYIDLLKRLVAKFSNNTGLAVSDFLNNPNMLWYDSKPFNCIVVPGMSVRNLPNAVIKTTLDDLLQDLRVMYSLGSGIEGANFRVEPSRYFYQKNTVAVTLESNGPVKKSYATDLVYNRIKVGFNDSVVDEINGLQEFCCEHIYSCGLESPDSANREMDLVSPYIHGMYSIENIRAYIFRTDSTSSTKDNEVCVVEVNSSMTTVAGVAAYEPSRGVFGGLPVVTGLKYASDAWNLGHCTKTCLIRNMEVIKSYLPDGHVITFQTANKNALVRHGSASSANVIVGNSNIEITSGGAKAPGFPYAYPNIQRLFLPIIHEFRAQMPVNFLALMDSQVAGVFLKYGIIRLDDDGVPQDVFILDSTLTPGTESDDIIRGLCSPNTNLLNLRR